MDIKSWNTNNWETNWYDFVLKYPNSLNIEILKQDETNIEDIYKKLGCFSAYDNCKNRPDDDQPITQISQMI